MNIKRSYFKLLMASATVGLFLANCTVKNATDDTDLEGNSCEDGDTHNGCKCPDDSIGFQECNSKGVFGKCVCEDNSGTAGTNNSTAGKGSGTAGTDNEGGAPVSTGGTTYAGSSSGGVAPAAGGAGGEGGAAPVFVPTDPNDCEACLQALCAKEYQACLDDEQCYSAEGDGSGQYERIISCVDDERLNGLVKRDVVRGCGVTMGLSANPDLASDWAPQNMAPATTNLLNCLATSSSETPNADWSNSDDNFPIVNDDVVPTPWPEDSCAKLSCTAKFQ